VGEKWIENFEKTAETWSSMEKIEISENENVENSDVSHPLIN